MSEELTLLPCPFCGGEAELHPTYFLAKQEISGWFVWCGNDGCAVKPMTPDYETYIEAIAVWNSRTAPKLPPGIAIVDADGEVVDCAERTCRMEYQTGSDNPRRGWWLCDSCDGLTDSVGSGWNGEKQRMNPPSYCARCGAKVVE